MLAERIYRELRLVGVIDNFAGLSTAWPLLPRDF
jgi:hypothetical protein